MRTATFGSTDDTGEELSPQEVWDRWCKTSEKLVAVEKKAEAYKDGYLAYRKNVQLKAKPDHPVWDECNDANRRIADIEFAAQEESE